MKSSLNRRIPELGNSMAIAAIVGMLLGLFISRALLSIGIFVFFLSAPVRLGVLHWLGRSVKDPLFWIFGSLWLLPLLSGFWSSDKQAWLDVIRIKLPLLLLPMGWVGLSLSYRWYVRVGWFLTGLTFLGAVYTLFNGFVSSQNIIQEYLSGKTLITPLDNDRVRFSWVVIAVLFWLRGQWHAAAKNKRFVLLSLSIFLILFLHVLAVRIGLLSFYLLTLFFLIQAFSKPLMRKWAVLLLLLLFLLPVGMYFSIPTFRARVDYIRYDWSFTLQGKYLPGGNDAVRVRSLQLAGEVVQDNPWAGVGFGDIRSEMDQRYRQLDAGSSNAERIYPANEWAVYGVGMGWIGLFAITAAMIRLFFIRTTDVFSWRSWVLVSILSMVTDIGLEVQYGVFLIPFLLLFFRSFVVPTKIQEICA